MGKYVSTEQRISIPLSEYQRLTLDSRILTRMVERSNSAAELKDKCADQLYKEDMSNE